MKKHIVGITSCPTGIAHTFMAAEGLKVGAEKLGYTIKVETQGSVGSQNTLTDADIAEAEVVIIAADITVDLDRFGDKVVYQTKTKAAINDGLAVVTKALEGANLQTPPADTQAIGNQAIDSSKVTEKITPEETDKKDSLPSAYKHLMTGFSHMLPFVVAAGLLIALGVFIGSLQFGENGIHIYRDEYSGSLGAVLYLIGKGALDLFIPVLGGYIAYSLAGRAGLAAGMVGGYMAAIGGSGFLGAILAGFLAGYLVLAMLKYIKLPKTMEGLMPIFIIPLFSVMIVGLLMHYVIGTPMAIVNVALTDWLKQLTGVGALLLGVMIGCMMSYDIGGPMNKIAYIFATCLLGEQVYAPMAAVMAAGMTPPLAIFVASLLFKDIFLEEEKEATKAAGVLGISFITEGAIPFATRDPRVIPTLMSGSAVAGALSMLFNCGLVSPHGGVFVFFIPNAVNNLLWYIVAILAGTMVTAVLLKRLKKTVVD